MSGMLGEDLGPKHHSEIPGIMNEAAALVFASCWECMPTVVLDAMAAGIPVISTAVGQMSSIKRDGETGFLIDHTYGSFERAVLSVLNDGPAVDSITKRASELVREEFSLVL